MITLVGSNALGFDETFKPVPFTYLWREDVLAQTLNLLGREMEHVPDEYDVTDERTISFINIWSNNYFHAIFECLAPLAMHDPESIDTVLVKGNAPCYLIEGIKLLGYEGKIRKWHGGIYGYTNLIEPYKARVNGYPAKECLDTLKATLAPETVSKKTKVFVSRLDAHTRVPSEGIEKPLCPDYAHIRLTGWTLHSQILLFSTASHIAGIHGAGLSNMVWSGEGTKVTEYFLDYHNPCYEKLAEVLELEYERIDL